MKYWQSDNVGSGVVEIFNNPGVATGDRGLPDEPATKPHIGMKIQIISGQFLMQDNLEDHTLDRGFRRIRRHLTKREQEELLDDEQV